jgi:acyl carrier protein
MRGWGRLDSTESSVAAQTESEIRDSCIGYLAKALKRPAQLIDPNAKFARLGVDSATSVFLLVELEELLGTELPANLVFEYPTIAQLARQIASRASVVAPRNRLG